MIGRVLRQLAARLGQFWHVHACPTEGCNEVWWCSRKGCHTNLPCAACDARVMEHWLIDYKARSARKEA
jgi:hypothetical protein